MALPPKHDSSILKYAKEHEIPFTTHSFTQDGVKWTYHLFRSRQNPAHECGAAGDVWISGATGQARNWYRDNDGWHPADSTTNEKTLRPNQKHPLLKSVMVLLPTGTWARSSNYSKTVTGMVKGDGEEELDSTSKAAPNSPAKSPPKTVAKKSKSQKEGSYLPLTKRPLDLVYFIFLLSHAAGTLMLVIPNLYAHFIGPTPLKSLLLHYYQMTADPLVGGVAGLLGPIAQSKLQWFLTFNILEAVFQLPLFIYGMHGLRKGSTSVYIPLIFYAGSTITSTLPCVVAVLTDTNISSQHMWTLLSNYVPFLLLPVYMAIDLSRRVQALMYRPS